MGYQCVSKVKFKNLSNKVKDMAPSKPANSQFDHRFGCVLRIKNKVATPKPEPTPANKAKAVNHRRRSKIVIDVGIINAWIVFAVKLNGFNDFKSTFPILIKK